MARERAKLQDLELEISHQLTDAVRQLVLNYELTQTNFNRTLAADRQVEALQAANGNGTGFGLISISGQVQRVMKLARLDKVFAIHDDLDAALTSIASVA